MSDYVTGFMDTAKRFGITEKQDMFSLKAAAAADPAIAAQMGGDPSQGQGGPPPPQGGPPPMDPSMGGGQPPLPGQLPPELEQLLSQLPPEVLQQLLAEVEQEVQGGGGGEEGGPHHGGGQGGPPQGGGQMPPQMGPKQGSAEEFILAKTAQYQEGFLAGARDHNLDYSSTVELYKRALAEMEANPIDASLFIDTTEKRAAHAEGVILAAMERGFSQNDAFNFYKSTFID